MNRNNPQPRVPTLKDLYGPKEPSLPWEEHQAEIVRFWTDSGDCWGFLFHHVSGTYYSAKERRLLIDWPLGTIVVTIDRVEKTTRFCGRCIVRPWYKQAQSAGSAPMGRNRNLAAFIAALCRSTLVSVCLDFPQGG